LNIYDNWGIVKMMKDSAWKYEDGLFQPTGLIYVDSLDGGVDMWFDVEERLLNQPRPSSKQWAAWDEFCRIDLEKMRQSVVKGLFDLAQRMELLPNDAKPQFGSTIRPKVMAKEARKAACVLNETDINLGKQSALIFKCDSLVVPSQDKAPVRFVIMNFEIGGGKRSKASYGYELEALFCNGFLLFAGENSGLWTRADWTYCFDAPDFDPVAAVHPFWQ
jgi:hypothetical protein